MPDGPSPKDRFTALDTLALVREVRALGPAHVDKAFDLAGGGWTLSLRAPGRGRVELLLVPGRYAALVDERPSHEEGLTPIAKELRRLLGGATLQGASEPRSERYLEISFRRPDAESLVLALEFFGAGNLVVARDGRIVAVSRPRAWAHRMVRVGAEYQRPPERGDPWGMTTEQLEAELRRSHTDLTSTLAARLALGGPVAEEVLSRSGIASGAGPFPSSVAVTLHRTIAELLAEVKNPPQGYVYERDGAAVDATPYRSRRWSADPTVSEQELPRFSDAVTRYFSNISAGPGAEEAPPPDPERALLERQRERQRAAAEGLEAAGQKLIEDGQAILSNFAEAESLLAAAPRGLEAPEQVEVSLGERRVTLLLGQPVRASAQALFDEAKRLQGKAAGARAALADTEARLSRPTVASPQNAGAAPAARPGARAGRWYTRFRWFVSSDGLLIVAGRDAPSNDGVVRRHLGARDLYFHADIHGAASVVVKAPERGEPVFPEATLAEAGRFAVAFSKAWRAGLASADAFWVNADQVSKTPTTGEFVARGAWVIHGTKHFLKDLPLELALGTVRVDAEETWIVAPEAAVRARGTVRYLLTPGEERERPAREVELSRETGLSRSLLQSLLPAGGLNARRT